MRFDSPKSLNHQIPARDTIHLKRRKIEGEDTEVPIYQYYLNLSAATALNWGMQVT